MYHAQLISPNFIRPRKKNQRISETINRQLKMIKSSNTFKIKSILTVTFSIKV
jgi:hypothetical protein